MTAHIGNRSPRIFPSNTAKGCPCTDDGTGCLGIFDFTAVIFTGNAAHIGRRRRRRCTVLPNDGALIPAIFNRSFIRAYKAADCRRAVHCISKASNAGNRAVIDVGNSPYGAGATRCPSNKGRRIHFQIMHRALFADRIEQALGGRKPQNAVAPAGEISTVYTGISS